MTSKRKWGKMKPPPEGFDYIQPVLDALENELRDQVNEPNGNKRNAETTWPIHQINWQRSRYVYDMFYVHKNISRQVYDYCIKNKLCDASLIAKWKKPGYERLCSTYVINPKNYKFGTASICRVPVHERSAEQRDAIDPTTGCRGCASGCGGRDNIFGNRFGQALAAVQFAREAAGEEEERKRTEARARADAKAEEGGGDGSEGSDWEDYGPAPPAAAAAPVEAPVGGAGDSETDSGGESSDEEDYGPAPPGAAPPGGGADEGEGGGGRSPK
eukprot:CAMPEP_0194337550 /NCGR_PEP_ID=MMETSP0171-20130528/76664_1 /TAXON_ID=218684 /ORGANISM="Corethron pennatum, Strain L29A3" /LENGTH=271 /DNA_ID=CAMNT_0039101373 /DNA_START=164 /DNA_END=976 /DNA_ORIENTATION=-